MATVNPSLTGPVFRVDSMEHQCLMMEKRQLFLRSYQFSRKRTLSERIKRSFTRIERVLCFRLRSARRLRKLVCSRLSRLRHRLCYSRRRSRFLRVLCSNSFCSNQKSDSSSSCFSCFS
ncbi:uncharacterized protein LOC115740249 [Rhodamnia argentea]|uniref:Uncharacterized protein LOC115740249 n=1 Tax=Rhodamnia argentea TaxID=178133 RepID=A0A8B8P4R3_9MYRT|nr:uncharacterized protein LOC115740249 [Rhodamnia argentea]